MLHTIAAHLSCRKWEAGYIVILLCFMWQTAGLSWTLHLKVVIDPELTSVATETPLSMMRCAS